VVRSYTKQAVFLPVGAGHARDCALLTIRSRTHRNRLPPVLEQYPRNEHPLRVDRHGIQRETCYAHAIEEIPFRQKTVDASPTHAIHTQRPTPRRTGETQFAALPQQATAQ
jgi:hypothetical protein